MLYKAIPFTKDVDMSKRTARIAHAAYNNIDRTKDISKPGMFNKSWEESKSDISFYLNHDDTLAPGKVTGVSEDKNFAYTDVWLGNHTLGNDTLIMMDEGVIKNASFGYIPVKSDKNDKGIRTLKEVKHIETSVLTKMPANPSAGVVNVFKSFDKKIDFKSLSDNEQSVVRAVIANGQNSLSLLINLALTLDVDSDLYTSIMYMISRAADLTGSNMCNLCYYGSKELAGIKTHVKTMEKFVRDTRASDDAITLISAEIETAKSILSEYDTASTRVADEPDASVEEKEFADSLYLLTLKI